MTKVQLKICNYQFVFDEKSKFAMQTELQKLEGQEAILTLDKKRKVRSHCQNKYYWGVVIPTLCQHFGYIDNEADQVHESLKELFIPEQKRQKNLFTKGYRKRMRTTSDLTTAEYELYLSRIRTWASGEHSCYILQPNESEIYY